VAGGWEAGWRVKEWTKKFNPAVDNPTVAVPKPKPRGNEGVKVRRGDEHLGRARVDKEPVPFLHGHVEGLDVREYRWETTREAAGSWEGRRRKSPPPKPKKEVGSSGRGAESLGDRPKGAGKETGKGGMER
jgi:hypothetical protein